MISDGEALGIWAAVVALCVVCVAVALGGGDLATKGAVVVAAVAYGLWWWWA